MGVAEGYSCWTRAAAAPYNISVAEVTSTIDTAGQLIAASSGLRRALRRRLQRGDGVSGLSDAQRELVRIVRRHPGIHVGEAALELHLAANTVSTLVTGLVAEGWIRRDPDPQDGRSALLSLTPEAERHVEEWRDRRQAVLTEALGSLGPDDRDRIAAALPALQRLVESVKAE